MRTRFRGLDARDGVLLEGQPAGASSALLGLRRRGVRRLVAAAREAADLGWPAPVRTRVPVNVTVPAADPERARRIVLASGGCRTAKVKVAERGQSLAEEIARLEAVRDALGPGGTIRIDANGAWEVDEAVARLVDLDRAAGGLEYVEQPAPTSPASPPCADARTCPSPPTSRSAEPQDPLAVVGHEAADIVVLKVQPLGGVRACLELAEQVGLPVVVSSALESSVGLAAGVALAAALPRAALRLRAGHRPAAHCRHRRRAVAARRRRDRRPSGPSPSPRRSPPAAPEVARRWAERVASARVARRPTAGHGGGAAMTTASSRPGDNGARGGRARPSSAWCRGRRPRPGLAQRAPRLRPRGRRALDGERPPEPRACVCTCVSTSATRASSRSASPGRPRGVTATPRAGAPRPVAVVTTSGTAVANLHPAVLEAHHAGVPLLLLTADRPHELRGTGANQTTDQVGIFGSAVRFALDVPAPDGPPGEARDLRRSSVARASPPPRAPDGDPGPVHLEPRLPRAARPGGRAVARAGGWPV